MRKLLAAVVVAVTAFLVPWSAIGNAAAAPAPPATAASQGSGDYLFINRKALMALPASGRPWESMLSVANSGTGRVNLANKDNQNAAGNLAAALVFARTGQAQYRDKVVAQLKQLTVAPTTGASVLSVGRQLAGYVMAADLVGYRDPAFVKFVSDLRTRKLPGHSRWYSLTATSDDSVNNWGAWALSSRIAASRFVGDKADVDRAAAVFRRFTGDTKATYTGLRKTADFDPSWACTSALVGINPTSCGSKAGAVVEDISRSAGTFPKVDATGLMYSWETLGAAVLSARLLAHGGYSDVHTWGDQALLRAGRFLYAKSAGAPPQYSVSQHVPWALNHDYATTIGAVRPATFGRQFGFTDWLG